MTKPIELILILILVVVVITFLFNASGNMEGDVLIIDSTKMKTHQLVKKAHLGLVTALTFSPDSRCLSILTKYLSFTAQLRIQ